MNSKRILVKGRNPKGFVQFLKEVHEALNEGWDVIDGKLPLSKVGYARSFGITLFKDESLHILDDPKSKKPDLLAYAEEVGIEVPEGMHAPAAIKKFLKEELGKKEESEGSKEEQE